MHVLKNERRFSAYIEDMGIDIAFPDYIVISHGHLAHTWGLDPLIRHYIERAFERLPVKRPKFIVLPEAFTVITLQDTGEICSLISIDKLDKFFNVQLHKSPCQITDKITFLGYIPRKYEFEGKISMGVKDNSWLRLEYS